MTDPHGSGAYDLSLFEPRKAKVTSIQPNKKQQKANRRRARLQSFLNAAAVMLTAVVVVGALGMLIVSRVRLTEMNNTIAGLQKELAILESETKSLTHTLAAQTSTQSVEEYARSHGMQKVESYQIDYFTVDGEKAEEEAEEPDFWQSLWNQITHFFGADA